MPVPRPCCSGISRKPRSSRSGRRLCPGASCLFSESACRFRLLLEHDPSGRARGHGFPKTGAHPGSSPGQAFLGIMLQARRAYGARAKPMVIEGEFMAGEFANKVVVVTGG